MRCNADETVIVVESSTGRCQPDRERMIFFLFGEFLKIERVIFCPLLNFEEFQDCLFSSPLLDFKIESVTFYFLLTLEI